MYVPSEQLNQVKKQALAEFGDEITDFEWWQENDITTIMLQTRSIPLKMPLTDRIREIVNSLIGDQYIVGIGVLPIQSVGATDGLFNLTFDGGINSFFIDYYAPERPRSNPFSVGFYDFQIFYALRTIDINKAEQLWERLINPAFLELAKQQGIHSFSKELLACKLRDFLLEHLDFIKDIAKARKKRFELFEPPPPLESSNES